MRRSQESSAVFGVGESLGIAEVEREIINVGFFGETNALKQTRGNINGFAAFGARGKINLVDENRMNRQRKHLLTQERDY